MLSPAEILNRSLRYYSTYLRSIITGETCFPLALQFGKPSGRETDFKKLQAEVTALESSPVGFRIEWTESNSRRWGRQRLPVKVWFENEAEFLRAIKKESEVPMFRHNVDMTRIKCPVLEEWLLAHPQKLAE